MNSKILYFFIIVATLFGCKHKEIEVPVKSSKSLPVTKNKAPIKKSTSNEGVIVIQQKLGLSSKEIKSSHLYSFITEWYGTPYKYSGCQRTGVDCSCFSNILYEKVYNKKIPRSAAEMFTICQKLNFDDAKEGDLVFFKMGGNIISHVGVILKRGYFVHSSTSKGVVINSLEEAYYKKFYFCAGKIRNS